MEKSYKTRLRKTGVLLLAPLWILLILFFQPLSGKILLAAAPARKTISLASWNIRNISTGSRSDAELGIISLIIFRHDFIALQEVLDREVIERIQSFLKKDFQVDCRPRTPHRLSQTTFVRPSASI